MSEKKLFGLLQFVTLLTLSTLFISTRGYGFYIRFFVYMPLVLLWSGVNTTEDNKHFLLILSNVIYFLAVTSLVIWTLGPLLKIINPIGHYTVIWGNLRNYSNYFFLLFTERLHVKMIGGFVLMRNLSIFPEGPFSSLIFTVGLAIHLFIGKDKVSRKKILVYIVAILTALSTIGFVMVIFIMGVYYVIKKMRTRDTNRGKYVLNVIVLPLGICALELMGIGWAMEQKELNDIGNYLSHMNAFKHGFEAFLNHPISGYGYNYLDNMGNSTSGIFKIMVYGGVPFVMFYGFPFLKGIAAGIKSKNYNYTAFCTVIFVLLVLVIWQNSALFLYMMCLFYIGQNENIGVESSLQSDMSNENRGMKCKREYS